MKIKTARRWLNRKKWSLISRGICKGDWTEIKGSECGSDRRRLKKCLKVLKQKGEL